PMRTRQTGESVCDEGGRRASEGAIQVATATRSAPPERARSKPMSRRLFMLTAFALLCGPSITLAGPKEEVAAATQAWIEGMTAHDVDRVVALYDAEAVLWGTRSPTIR